MNTEEWNRIRDEVLLRANVLEFVYFANYHKRPLPMEFEKAEIVMHQAITATLTLPMDHRARSKKWLADRGWNALDDGDVPMDES